MSLKSIPVNEINKPQQVYKPKSTVGRDFFAHLLTPKKYGYSINSKSPTLENLSKNKVFSPAKNLSPQDAQRPK